MDALKILSRGNEHLLESLDSLPESKWTNGFVNTSWTIKDVVDHIATYEELQVEAFEKFLNSQTSTPLAEEKSKVSYGEFNQQRREANKTKTPQEILKRYNDAYSKLAEIIQAISPEILSKPKTTEWYGQQCSLDDIIALNYGHKKHHIAQIKMFRKKSV